MADLPAAHPAGLGAGGARVDARGKAIIESWGNLPRLVDAAAGARLIMPWICTNAFFARLGTIEQVNDQIVANPFPPSAQGIYHQGMAISRCDTSDRLGAIDCPTLVLIGREDILLPVAFAEQLVWGIRRAELVVLEKTGHGMLIESPDAVASVMLGFLCRRCA